MKTALQNTNLTLTKKASALIQLIYGSLTILSNSSFSGQSVIFSSFLSSITLKDSAITNVIVNKSTMEIVSSTLMISNMTFENITNPIKKNFIYISDSQLDVTNLYYKNSDSSLFNIIYSSANISNLKQENVNGGMELIKLDNCNSIYLSKIELINTTTITKSLIVIDRSKAVVIENIVIANISQIMFKISKSEISSINSVNIEKCLESFRITESRVALLSNSTFMQNGGTSKEIGGAIYLFNTEMNISNCSFTLNSAKIGGVISFQCNSLAKCVLNISNSSFTNNTAQEKGGAIYYNYNNPSISNVTFESNTALYGPNLASYPVRIGLLNSTANHNITIDNVGSGIKLAEPISLALFDYDDQVMNLENSRQIKIQSTYIELSAVNGINTVSMKEGISIFNSIWMTSNAWSQPQYFTISSKAIDKAKILALFKDNINQTSLIINFRDCLPGEQISENK